MIVASKTTRPSCRTTNSICCGGAEHFVKAERNTALTAQAELLERHRSDRERRNSVGGRRDVGTGRMRGCCETPSG